MEATKQTIPIGLVVSGKTSSSSSTLSLCGRVLSHHPQQQDKHSGWGEREAVGDREMGVVNSGEEGGVWSTSLGVCIWLAHLS